MAGSIERRGVLERGYAQHLSFLFFKGKGPTRQKKVN